MNTSDMFLQENQNVEPNYRNFNLLPDLFVEEATPNAEKKTSRRFNNLNENQLDNIVVNAESKRTRNNTKWAITTFEGNLVALLNKAFRSVWVLSFVFELFELKH